ncbi:ion channel [Bacillus massiliigorillae]|uniref:ion channel n=1 Tax=Bacillus massiliigorillae TaxID=1243664 RepID=UPI0005A7D6AA|nr:ion channel [Bacillus massiliigorillae]
MDFYILVGAVIFCMVMSVRAIFTPIESGIHKISISHFLWLVYLYGTICIGFAMLYLLFELKDMSVILDHGIQMSGNFFLKLETSFYFSAMTMFSVGYGELIPIGIGRIIATIQAFVGYTLPAAFVVRTVIDLEQGNK